MRQQLALPVDGRTPPATSPASTKQASTRLAARPLRSAFLCHATRIRCALKCSTTPSAPAQPAVAADRFAREIVRIRIMEGSVPGDGAVEFAYCGRDRGSKCRPPSPPAPRSQYGILRLRPRIHEFGLRRARNLSSYHRLEVSYDVRFVPLPAVCWHRCCGHHLCRGLDARYNNALTRDHD